MKGESFDKGGAKVNDQKREARVLEITKQFIEDLNAAFLRQGGTLSAEEKDLLLEAADKSMRLRDMAKKMDELESLKAK